MAYYSSDKNIEKSLRPIKTVTFSSISDLYALLQEKGWCEYSAFNKSMWNPENKCNGQCNATVLLLQEFFGGDIIEYPNPSAGKFKHFFNRINGCDIDLTSEQFENELKDYNCQSKKAKIKSNFDYQKSAYILKLRLGLGEV